MMPVINGVMLAVSSSLAASIVAKVTVTTALALIGAWLARRSRAAVRHALLAAAFGVLLALPIASIVTPPVRIAVPAGAPERIVPASEGAARAGSPVAPADASVGVMSVVSRSARLSPSALLLTGWIAGTALFLLPVVMGLWQVRSLRRSALPWRHGQSLVERLAFDAGFHRRIEVLLHEALPSPMTCGAVHPAIVFSPDAQTWEADDLNRAIVHELEHVRRGDWVSHGLARAVCAVYWFHPLVWIAWRRLALEAERSCDDAVLGRSEATAYADQLVGLARRLSLSERSSAKTAAKSPLLAMANRADLATRVGAVLDSRLRRGRAGTLPVALAFAAAALLVLTVSPLIMVSAQQSATTDVTALPIPRLSANSGLVIEAVTVSDENGKTIEGLSANDFAVTEDGVAQHISVFEFQKLDAPQDSISSYYILGYYPRNQDMDGKFRQIKVTCNEDPTAKLNYRAGYYAMKSWNRAGRAGIGNSGVDHSIALDSNLPALLYKQEPEYSEEARKAKFQGVVILQILVDAKGDAVNPRVMNSLGLGLDEKAIEAVRQWKFSPVYKDGKPVAVPVTVSVFFRLL